MRKILSIVAVFALSAMAQFPATPVKSFEGELSEIFKAAYDVEHMDDGKASYVIFTQDEEIPGQGITFGGNYLPLLKRVIYILNMNTLTTEKTDDCRDDLGSVTAAIRDKQFTGYKNLFKSDGKWTFLEISEADAKYNLSVCSDGVYSTPLTDKDFISSPIIAGGKVYIVAASDGNLEVYLLRNNVPSTAAIWEKSSYGTAQKQINEKAFNQHFNVKGQQIPEVQFKDLQEIMKKTIILPKGI